jgi:hypothetical protein
MNNPEHVFDDRTPGVEEREPTASYLSYTAGLGLAIIATIASFIVAQTNLLWPPGHPRRIDRARLSADRRPSRLLFASGQRAGQHK